MSNLFEALQENKDELERKIGEFEGNPPTGGIALVGGSVILPEKEVEIEGITDKFEGIKRVHLEEDIETTITAKVEEEYQPRGKVLGFEAPKLPERTVEEIKSKLKEINEDIEVIERLDTLHGTFLVSPIGFGYTLNALKSISDQDIKEGLDIIAREAYKELPEEVYK